MTLGPITLSPCRTISIDVLTGPTVPRLVDSPSGGYWLGGWLGGLVGLNCVPWFGGKSGAGVANRDGPTGQNNSFLTEEEGWPRVVVCVVFLHESLSR